MDPQRVDLTSVAISALPVFRGKERLASAIGKIRCGIGKVEERCLSGTTVIRVDLRDRIQRFMWCGCYEPHVRRCMAALLRPGDTLIEIGAHIGYLTALAAHCVGAGGRVIAFEADPGNFLRLSEHLNGLSWVNLEPKAVWRTSSAMTFERSAKPGESGWGTLTSVRDLHAGEHLTVAAVSLDDWYAANVVQAVHGLKIDAEGSEVSILRGCKDFLGRFAPWIILERNQTLLHQAGASGEELAEILRAYGYRACVLDGTKTTRIQEKGDSVSGELLAVPIGGIALIAEALTRGGFEADRGDFN